MKLIIINRKDNPQYHIVLFPEPSEDGNRVLLGFAIAHEDGSDTVHCLQALRWQAGRSGIQSYIAERNEGNPKSILSPHFIYFGTHTDSRAFFPGCAGHWTAFRDRLDLTQADIPLYRVIHETIMSAIAEASGLDALAAALAYQLDGSNLNVRTL